MDILDDIRITIQKISKKIRSSNGVDSSQVGNLARLIDSYRGLLSDQREQDRKDKRENARARLENWQRRD